MNPLLTLVAAAQGVRVRRSVEMLPEAAGPTRGVVSGGASGTGALRVAVIGESTAAGCGAATHDDGFAGAFARELARRESRSVEWQVAGQHGATTRRVRHRLLDRVDREVDVAVLLIGVNDVLTRRPVEDWTEDLSAILGALASRADRVAVAGIPPFTAFPALPRTLARYLAGRAELLDAAAREVCAGRAGVTWLNTAELVQEGPEFFASDGFHPSSLGYEQWAQAVADVLPDEGASGR
ncbi:SGNH/GDSL hydrolase family protein [Mariniluteicoccus flavus]